MGRLPLGSLARHTRGRPLARPANGDARFDRRSAVLRRDVSDARAERRNILETVGEMTRASEGGRFATESPGLHSVAGRMGLGWKPPPQFGQTLWSLLSMQSTQKVHSYEQMRANVEFGGRSRSHHSQFGRSCKAMWPTFFQRRITAVCNWRKQKQPGSFRLKPGAEAVIAKKTGKCVCARVNAAN